MAKHEHEPAHRETTPPTTAADIATAAGVLLSAAERLGPRVTAHGPGCPAEYGGGCTCGATNFADAMRGMGDALRGAFKPA